MQLSYKEVHLLFAQYFTKDVQLQAYLYYLSYCMEQGHICISVNAELPEHVWQTLGLNSPPKFKVDTKIIGDASNFNYPFILDQNLLYTQRNFKYEVRFAQDLALKLNQTNRIDIINLPFEKYFDKLNDNNIDWQFVASVSALLHNVTFITGGPGTGKTTTVAKILSLLFTLNPQCNVALAAPTGKAAARLTESIRLAGQHIVDAELGNMFQKLEATTIHRLLGVIRNSIYFKHDEHNQLNYDVIVVDECSMIDLALFSKMLQAIPSSCKLIFLGDKNQLAAVEAGSIFGDLCTLFIEKNTFTADFVNQVCDINKQQGNQLKKHLTNATSTLNSKVVTLEHSYRFNDLDGIGILSKAIINYDLDALNNFVSSGKNNQVELDSKYDDTLFQEFVYQYANYIYDQAGNLRDITSALQHFNYCTVLCATRNGSNGIYNLNVKIEHILRQKGLIKEEGQFYNYKPIMVVENNYEQNIFNGDIGLIYKGEKDDAFKAYFLIRNEDGSVGVKSVLLSYLGAFETCYAMTIHKSQGSELDRVLVILPEQEENQLLNRELIYTAITRAKKWVLIQATSQVFLQACSKQMQRNSGITLRLE